MVFFLISDVLHDTFQLRSTDGKRAVSHLHWNFCKIKLLGLSNFDVLVFASSTSSAIVLVRDKANRM